VLDAHARSAITALQISAFSLKALPSLLARRVRRYLSSQP
jgi:hypothetical protein